MARAVFPPGSEAAANAFALSPAIASHSHLFLIGLTGSAPDGTSSADLKTQFRAAFDKIAATLAALILSALADPASAATYGFCWQGANDYRIEGYISYPDTAEGRIVTENTITGFGITGWRGDTYLGRWSMKDLTPDTSWTLRFDTRTLSFPMGGYIEDGTYQEWNANGFANDCGIPSFGFNGGNRAQDICVDGVFIEESGVAPDTPLAISPNAEDPCGPVPMSSLSISGRIFG